MEKKSVADAYAAARRQAERQLRELQALLDAHARRHACEPENWALVGDLKRVDAILEDALEALGAERDS